MRAEFFLIMNPWVVYGVWSLRTAGEAIQPIKVTGLPRLRLAKAISLLANTLKYMYLNEIY